jgi:DNA-binding transcriptional regulator YiaG
MESVVIAGYNIEAMDDFFDNLDLAELCKQIRKEENLSQTEMAMQLGIPVSTYQGWEKGISEPRGKPFLRLLSMRARSRNLIKLLLQ